MNIMNSLKPALYAAIALLGACVANNGQRDDIAPDAGVTAEQLPGTRTQCLELLRGACNRAATCETNIAKRDANLLACRDGAEIACGYNRTLFSPFQHTTCRLALDESTCVYGELRLNEDLKHCAQDLESWTPRGGS